MKAVYGVWSGYEDFDGVFSTKEKAEEYVNAVVEVSKRSRGNFSVFEYEVDGLCEQVNQVLPSPSFKGQLDSLVAKYGPPGKASEFMMDITRLVMSAIQAGRAAAQGAEGIVICGKCNKVVHQCK